ncbi:hypothetical protein [Streptomyces himalayensis]|uniref:Uncharacterized protein n=1 Tax=Streptomyces himalayensis subsp. himalayensis TaxID=2756131 RepID=A0A7W0DMY6_9ACTN|nr:hypothetical protein [Streptomyces himalayensis]MBA2947608.1 hypothetical protein [Streptomyces himalayensis subsp. himalayensis]
MMDVRVLVDVVVVASVVPALAITPRVLVRRPDPVGAADRRVFSPAAWLALVTGLIYVNQVLFTVYVLRVHDGDPSFVARYLPAGWFDLASAHPVLRDLAEHFPAPGLLAPSVLRIQAFLELPFVLLSFATVVRWLDADLYRRIARSALLPLASVSYTTVFCLVEWDLRNPYTVDDVVIRAVSAVVTPLLLASMAARDTGTTRVPASVPGLLVFTGSLGALGALVLVVYDTALLYNLGRLDDRLPLALAAAAALLVLRAAASRLPARSAPTLSFVVHAVRHWLLLFFIPALAIRYGLLFGTPRLALSAGALTAAVACVRAAREMPTGAEQRPRAALHLTARIGCAVLAGAAGAALALRVTPPSYKEVALLSAMGAFLVTAVAVCGLLDRSRRE